MTDAALTAINRLARSSRRFICCETTCPRHLICIDVDDAGFRINCGTTPLSSAIESWKVDGLLVQSKWNEQPITAERTELIDRPRVSFGRSIRQHVFGEQLSGVRSRLERSRLCRRCQLARNRASGILLFFDRKQWFACRAIEEI